MRFKNFPRQSSQLCTVPYTYLGRKPQKNTWTPASCASPSTNITLNSKKFIICNMLFSALTSSYVNNRGVTSATLMFFVFFCWPFIFIKHFNSLRLKNAWMNRRKDGLYPRTDGRTDERTQRRVNGGQDEWTDEWVDRRANGRSAWQMI